MLLLNLAALTLPLAALASPLHGSIPAAGAKHLVSRVVAGNATSFVEPREQTLAEKRGASGRKPLRVVKKDGGNGFCKVRHGHNSSASASAPASAPATTSVTSQPWSVASVATTSSSSSEVYLAPTTTTSTWVAPTTSTSAAPTTTSFVAVEAAVVTTSTHHNKAATTSSTTTWAAATTSAASNPVASVVSSVAGSLLAITEGSCGYSDPSSTTSNTAGPNGLASWMTCGINNGGWAPPFVSISELVSADLRTVIASGNNPFSACSAYVDKMYQYGSQYGIPPIMIASFAMQESTCNPAAVGGGGEQGLFQISKDKCGGAPGGNCQDIDYNMSTAMKYFSDTLSGLGGDVFQAVGQYNGWYAGLTYGAATAAATSGCCRCQNNLDYLHQFFNGWMQGLNGNQYGTYWNLNSCS